MISCWCYRIHVGVIDGSVDGVIVVGFTEGVTDGLNIGIHVGAIDGSVDGVIVVGFTDGVVVWIECRNTYMLVLSMEVSMESLLDVLTVALMFVEMVD